MTSHLEDGIIQELLDGEIHSSALPPIQSHLAGCAECRARLEAARVYMAEADGLIELLDEPAAAPTVVIPLPTRSTQSWTRRLAWAASVVIAVGAGWYTRGEVLGTAGGESRVASREGGAVPTDSVVSAVDSVPVVAAAPAPARQAEREAAGGGAGKREAVALADEIVKPSVATPPAREAANSAELLRGAPAGSALGAVAAAPPAARAENQLARERRADVVARDQVATKQLIERAPPQEISFSDAVRLLGGTLRLIEGMVPSRLESVGATVRVIYPVSQGELVLAQSVTNGVWTVRLTGPALFPTDSLAVLRKKVKE